MNNPETEPITSPQTLESVALSQKPMDPEQKKLIETNISKARQDMALFEKQYKILKKNYPEHFENIHKKHPQISHDIEQAMNLLKHLGTDNKKINDHELVETLDTYRILALKINQTLGAEKRQITESQQRGLEAASRGELPINTTEINDAEKAQLRQFAEDVYNEFFPESNIDQFVRWTTGQKKLEGYQKLLLGPANGIESVVSGVVSLFKPKTYQDFAKAVETGIGMTMEEWCNTWKTIKFMHENLPAADQIAPVISFLTAITTLVGGVGRIGQIARQMGYSAETIAILSRVTHNTNIVGKALPITVMAGLSMPLIQSIHPDKPNINP